MLNYKDAFGVERAIDVSLSTNGKWINWTEYTPKRGSGLGRTVQIPIEHKAELIEMINKA